MHCSCAVHPFSALDSGVLGCCVPPAYKKCDGVHSVRAFGSVSPEYLVTAECFGVCSLSTVTQFAGVLHSL